MIVGQKPNISHLRIFWCTIYVLIAPSQLKKMDHQRRLGIYVGFVSPSIIKYLKPLICNLFTAHFAIVIVINQFFKH
ncbi:hypothetical protein GQ457_18G004240 [Hibiscus cannabinus]